MNIPRVSLRRSDLMIFLTLSLAATGGCKKESTANAPQAAPPPSQRSAAVPSLDDEAVKFMEALIANHMTKTGLTYSFVIGDPSNATLIEIRAAGKPVTEHYAEDPGVLGTEPGGAPITEADRLNGVQWHGHVALNAVSIRTGRNQDGTVEWGDWRSAGSGPSLDQNIIRYAQFDVEKRSGQWICNGPMGGWGSMRPSAAALKNR